jgi:hypothetical protein
MILQAGNPDAMKRKAMRLNPQATLESFANTTGDKNPAKYVRGGFVPMEKGPNAVPPPQMNLWERPVYVPEQGYVRRGADDFLRVQSRGF